MNIFNKAKSLVNRNPEITIMLPKTEKPFRIIDPSANQGYVSDCNAMLGVDVYYSRGYYRYFFIDNDFKSSWKAAFVNGLFKADLFIGMYETGDLFLFPITLDGKDHKYEQSCRSAVIQAQKSAIQRIEVPESKVFEFEKVGCGFNATWPANQSFNNIFTRNTMDYLIENDKHPVYQEIKAAMDRAKPTNNKA